jgi:hypothetical protein
MRLVRLALNALGAFLLLLGFVSVLQGTNILPGSFMTGEPIWAAAGAVVACRHKDRTARPRRL